MRSSYFLPGSYARPFNWPIQTAVPTMQPVRQDRRVSMGASGDLYFSHVLSNDSVADYCCNARFPHKSVIQQKMPVVVKILTSESEPESLADLFGGGSWVFPPRAEPDLCQYLTIALDTSYKRFYTNTPCSMYLYYL